MPSFHFVTTVGALYQRPEDFPGSAEQQLHKHPLPGGHSPQFRTAAPWLRHGFWHRADQVDFQSGDTLFLWLPIWDFSLEFKLKTQKRSSLCQPCYLCRAIQSKTWPRSAAWRWRPLQPARSSRWWCKTARARSGTWLFPLYDSELSSSASWTLRKAPGELDGSGSF